MGARTEITTMVGGRIDSVLIAPGEKVHAGQPIAFVISGEAALMRANADAASAEADAARLEYQRDQNLVEQGVVARRELEASRARSLAADAAYRAARAQTKAIGSPRYRRTNCNQQPDSRRCGCNRGNAWWIRRFRRKYC